MLVFGLPRFTPSIGRHWGLSPSLAMWVGRHASQHDVVHIHQTWGLVQVTALLAAAQVRRPSVVTPHESLTDHDVAQRRSTAKAALRRLYVARASLIVFASQLEAKDSVPTDHGGRIAVIPHPLAETNSDRAPSNGHATGRPLVVGFLGRLHEKKNLGVLIRAVARAAPDMRLRIAGSGPPEYQQSLAAMAVDVGAEDRVEWLGFVPRSERDAFLDSIDVLAMPSRYECFGMAAAEAMARGVATIVSSSTGIAELASKHDGGRVVAPTEEAFATALGDFDRDRSRVEGFALRGMDVVRAELTMQTYGERMRRQYERVLDGAGE